MKKIIVNVIFTIVVLFSSTLQADPVTDLIRKKMSEYSSRNDIVMIVFRAKGDVNSALGNIKTAMHTRDPGGFLNPYWIVSFPADAVSSKTNCGVIFGEWYANGFPARIAWQDIMNRAINENAESGTYFYSDHGTFRETTDREYVSEAVQKTCF